MVHVFAFILPIALTPGPSPLGRGEKDVRGSAWRAGGSSLRSLSVISPVSVCSVPALALTHDSSLDTHHSEKPSPPAPLP
ncbi:MAG: hypothetical protein BroJett007_02990 [Chloroflexota bacterium]|nr:MAG: hypothetical protein BroJett007_02990 [Chloroflexota bacterium]